MTKTKTFFAVEIIEYKDEITEQSWKNFDYLEEAKKFIEEYNSNQLLNSLNNRAIIKYEFQRFPFNLQK